MNGPATAGTSNFSPVEFVESLSADDKQAVLDALLREVIARHAGAGVVSMNTLQGEWIGTLMVADHRAAAADQIYARLIPETRESLMKPFLDFDWDNTLSDEEVDAILRGEGRPRTR